jgi:DNA polymerase-3 subunit epsilon
MPVNDGHRVIEIGCVEVEGRRLTGRHFHIYLQPDREIDEGAIAVHGITNEDLKDKPRFKDVADEFYEFIKGAQLIIHNAPFDLGFLNHEFKLLNLPDFSDHIGGVIDTLVQAKELHPGKRNSLDALCDRYGISNSHRKLHGALLDAELLADVYLAMTRGQNSLGMDVEEEVVNIGDMLEPVAMADIIFVPASEEELAAHADTLAGLDKAVKGQCIWTASLNPPVPA